MIRQSVCFGCFTGGDATPEQVIKEAAKIGFKSVEMAPQEHWPLIKDSGLDIARGQYRYSRRQRHSDADLFLGQSRGKNRGRRPSQLCRGLTPRRALSRRKGHHPVYGVAQLEGQPSGLPVR
jgi:hypothetical protein